ncbi:hypothetical protein AB0F17_28850 [Nonomuraea sp. NPDC026600]|uniref:hypothetical protein n=1 Tax=Nonomuraea sp. NPDC026600 TaxID=3155363 RepID=UPI0034066032
MNEDLPGRLAVLAARQADDHERVSDHEVRLRLVETAVVSLSALPQIVTDLEQRQRSDEKYRYALPLSAFGAGAGLVATLVAMFVK